MNRAIAVALWFFAPSVQVWRETRARAPTTQRLPVRAAITHALPRTLLFGALVWTLWSGNWYAAAIIAITMMLLVLLSRGIAQWMMKRWGGSNAG